MRGGSHFHKNSELGNAKVKLINLIKEERKKNPVLVEVIEPPTLPVAPIADGAA